MVKLIRVNRGKVTLAIGDGANDCNMIQEANVGVGLYGKLSLKF
jgi:P-type E1-E2 ATPase